MKCSNCGIEGIPPDWREAGHPEYPNSERLCRDCQLDCWGPEEQPERGDIYTDDDTPSFLR